ncbi:MAG: NUDIX hydrolase [Gemmataceae bacterium]
MPREPIPTWCFALVVVRRGDKFLLIHEVKHGQLWYLPAGRVEPGESFAAAAVRETQEEGGIPVRLMGILRVEHSPLDFGSRMRVIFVAEPTDDTPPKSVSDSESLEAAWVSLEELSRYPLRGDETRDLFKYVADGGTIYPLEVLQPEGTPFVGE